ncbi:MAG: hypothetical protein Q9219_000832 [cf. Caloplaca sp. 3 TL-2023]
MAHVYNSQLDAFDLYHQIQEAHRPISTSDGPALPALGHALAGSAGAAISNVLTYPVALIVTRLQIQRSLRKASANSSADEYVSIRHAAQTIYNREGGLAGLYAGIYSDTGKTIADSFLFFLAYNFLHQTRLRSREKPLNYLPVTEELGVGFLAGAFSKLLTTPIANVVTRQQAAALLSPRDSKRPKETSIRAISARIKSEKGLQGFWSGYSASLILTLNPSLTFLLFETFKRLVLPRKKRSDTPPLFTFLLAAVSKAIASAVTYPFSLAKTRAQTSSESVNEKAGEEVDSSEKSQDGALSATKDVQAKARKYVPSNIITAVLQIARTEGLSALYEGLGGEVLKGFFSHGITMIVKQLVHRIIIQLYYTVLKLLKRFPIPEAAAGTSHLNSMTFLNWVT